MSVKRLQDKVVVVYGGLGLLGRSVCRSIAKEGGTPVIADVSRQNYQDWLKDEDLQEEAFPFVHTDVLERAAVDSSLASVQKRLGRVDAIVNCAYPRNKNYGRSFFDVEFSDFVENVGSLLGCYFNVMQRAAKFFVDNNGGNIVNISSIYGVVAPKFEIYEGTIMTTPIEYAAAKSALQHISRYTAKYLKGLNVRVNCVSPGGLLDKQPKSFLDAYNKQCTSKGMLISEDIIGTILFLLSNDSAFINGQNIVVDDGFTL